MINALRHPFGPRLKKSTGQSVRIHLIVFDDPDRTVGAVTRLHEAGFEVVDVHSPFPLHGLDGYIAIPESRISFATLIGGLTGLVGGIGLEIWTHTIGWPLNIGGKTNLALPAIIPIGFELTILISAIATVIALLVRSRLRPRFSSELPPGQPIPEVTDDRFAVLVAERDASHAPGRFADIIKAFAPERVEEGWRVL